MNQISFKNRIALYFSITTAILIALVFVMIFFTVRSGVYNDLDNDLRTEADVLLKEIKINHNSFTIADEEWKEKEHNTLDINPIFIQFINSDGKIFEKSPNLKGANLTYGNNGVYNSMLNGATVRQYQLIVSNQGTNIGYIIVATPMQEALQLLANLERVLLIAYPLILAVLFSVARFLAGRSITPVKDIIDTSEKITRENLSGRIPLPFNKDELYTLSKTINALLSRIENALEREKQFTSDASHELRTPLAVIKGTLEVLKRKPRSREEYEEKIDFCLTELDRINSTVDQLLLLARFESQTQLVNYEPVNLNVLFHEITARYSQTITTKSLKIIYKISDEITINNDRYLLSIIIDNLVSNAVKYTGENKSIILSADIYGNKTQIVIEDNGVGIDEKDMDKIFNPFFRSRDITYTGAAGSGIGLSIVQRLCELLHIDINIKSVKNKGTIITLVF